MKPALIKLLGVLVILVLISPQNRAAPAQDNPSPDAVHRDRTFTPSEIFKLIRARQLSKDDLVKLLGQPDFKCVYKGQDLWQYYNLTRDDFKKDKLWHQYFLFDNSRVYYDWVSGDAGPPREKQLAKQPAKK